MTGQPDGYHNPAGYLITPLSGLTSIVSVKFLQMGNEQTDYAVSGVIFRY
jgi:hypothetical protein